MESDNREIIYEDLLAQYNKLSEEEQRAILIYKSNFFYHINVISSIDNFENKSATTIFEEIDDKKKFTDKFEAFKKTIMNHKNIVVRYSVFKNINLNDIISFIENMKEVYQILKDARTKIKLCDDIVVYRGISVKKNEEIQNISLSNIISTSIKVEDANDFIYQKPSDESYLFVISLKKGTNVLVTPLSLVIQYEDGVSMFYNDSERATLKIVNRGLQGQQEIILFVDTLQFVTNEVHKLPIEGCSDLIIHKINSEPNLGMYVDRKMNR